MGGMKKKTSFWAALFAGLFLLGGGAWLALGRLGGGTVAEVTVDGEVLCRVELSQIAVPYRYTVETDWGTNVLEFARDGVEVVSADCPDQVCVHQGRISDSLVPIVCMPHRLVVSILEE